jgi:hypothetical protein
VVEEEYVPQRLHHQVVQVEVEMVEQDLLVELQVQEETEQLTQVVAVVELLVLQALVKMHQEVLEVAES